MILTLLIWVKKNQTLCSNSSSECLLLKHSDHVKEFLAVQKLLSKRQPKVTFHTIFKVIKSHV